ncbi:glycosyltransferase [Flavobacterium frigidarium]|uniref:glycosyltransferase n=1 Tax=Flavobacterium frigidarium TaxID=99286 RepID=UPI00040C3052|nr:glycosyltransferase [Flavobacterium frigidarium]
MKIIIVITDYGSFNNFLAELAVSLSSENEIHVISSSSNVINIVDKFDYNKYNLAFHTVDIPRSTSIIKLMKTASAIRKIVKRVNPNLIYAHFTTGIFPAIFFRIRNIEYWGTFHGLGMNASSGVRKAMFSIVELYCFMRLDKRFLINNKDYKLVSDMFKENTLKYNSCGVGCDIIKFDRNRFTEVDKSSLKKDLNIEDKFVVTYTGRFVEFKGFDLVYYSFLKLAEQFPGEVVLLLIGGRDPIHKTGLTEKEESDLFKNKNIVNIGYTSEVEKYLVITDVFLFPSKKEGLPVCIVEALAMGVPVISLDERGNSDVVRNDVNGYLITSVSKSSDVIEIVKKIKFLFLDEDKLRVLSLNCLSNRNIYSRSFFVEEQLKLFNNFKLSNNIT